VAIKSTPIAHQDHCNLNQTIQSMQNLPGASRTGPALS
jgi:hypothetical protein